MPPPQSVAVVEKPPSPIENSIANPPNTAQSAPTSPACQKRTGCLTDAPHPAQ